MNFGRPHLEWPSLACRIGALLLGLFLLAPTGDASALALKADVMLIPDPTGEPVSGEVTFTLPKKVRIGDTTFKICPTDESLCGRTHTCTLRPEESQDPKTQGNTKLFLRHSRGSKIGGVSVGAVTAGAGWLLLAAGCDGILSTNDAFQGDIAALYADVAIIAAQALTSTHANPDGLSIKDELISRYQIDACRDNVDFKILDFHGFSVNNRGGSATGLGSAKVKIKFRKSC
jgi:hypothetical protein